MYTYLFVLGREAHVSAAELTAVLLLWNVSITTQRQDNKNLVITTSTPIDLVQIMERLGGTVKIGEKIEESLVEYIDKTQPEGKIHFSLSGTNAKKEALKIKKELKSNGRSVRYIEANNTATILHNNLVQRAGDFTTVGQDLFVTRAIQPIEEFGKRDYEKPGADSKSGMLPPKLAKIMINLTQAPPKATLLDPFCGSGTVLMEALAMGYNNILGLDISEKAITDTKKNITWMKKEFGLHTSGTKVYASDVRAISAKKVPPDSIDAIATEPFMGKPKNGRETRSQLEQESKELGALYTDAFKTFAKIMKKGGAIVFIIPMFRHGDTWVKVNCVEKIKKLGFTVDPLSEKHDALLYWRRRQHVGREIWKFTKT